MCAGTCFTSGLIGHGCSVPPPRLECALALVEMPGSPRCPERSSGYLGLGRTGKLMWGSRPLGAVRDKLHGAVVPRPEASSFRGAQESKRITESGKRGARLMSGPSGSRVPAALGCSVWASIRVPLWSL